MGRPNKGYGVSDRAYNLTMKDQEIHIPDQPTTTQQAPIFPT